MIKYFYTFFVGFFLCSVSAQRVVVVDATSLEPIPGVVVYNLVKTKTNISNLDGKASIVRFQSFERIYFQHLSYRTKSGLKSKLNDTIFLAPKATDLNEIVISASKFEQSKKDNYVDSIVKMRRLYFELKLDEIQRIKKKGRRRHRRRPCRCLCLMCLR